MVGRRLFKTAAVLITLGYCSLLAYQGGVGFFQVNFQVRRNDVRVSDLSIDPVTRAYFLNDSESNKNLTLDDIFISVKTTQYHQDTRLPIILKTWFQLAKNQTWFFTDNDNPLLQNQTGGHMINTNCSASHDRLHLCCKLALEYDYFIESGKKWFCHFDDDNYVNVPRLVAVLQDYNPQEDWYLGRNSVNKPLEVRKRSKSNNKRMVHFWFATGGAGFCISRSLGLKMVAIASGGLFISTCDMLRYPDDVSMGYIIEAYLRKKLTVVNLFHSHLEQLKLLNIDTFRDQISFSYAKDNNKWNVVKVPGFDHIYDPTRFLSLHCFLFPHFKFCPR